LNRHTCASVDRTSIEQRLKRCMFNPIPSVLLSQIESPVGSLDQGGGRAWLREVVDGNSDAVGTEFTTSQPVNLV